MANVLNRQSRLYLKSVNTPDYPESDWIINPDLSAVSGLPSQYWVIETSVIDGPGIVDYDPDTGVPIYEKITLDNIRPMTVEERQTYDAAHPAQPIYTGQLSDGTPAYQYRGYVISINAQTVEFATRTTGTKNFYLNCSRNGTLKFSCVKESLIKSIKISGAPNAEYEIIFVNEQRTIHTQSGTTSDMYVDVAIPVSAGEEIQCYLQSANNFVNPQVELQIGTR